MTEHETRATTGDIVATLRSEARFRPTIWGDARPLLIAAADEIERLRELRDLIHEAVTNGCWTDGEQLGDWRISREVYDMLREADLEAGESTDV